MGKPIFGLSTTPVKDIRSELREQLERDVLSLVYRTTEPGMSAFPAVWRLPR